MNAERLAEFFFRSKNLFLSFKGAPEPEALKASQLWRARGRFYDLRAFAAKHPGGARVIQDCVGDDIEVLVVSHHLTDTPWAVLANYEVPFVFVCGGRGDWKLNRKFNRQSNKSPYNHDEN